MKVSSLKNVYSFLSLCKIAAIVGILMQQQIQQVKYTDWIAAQLESSGWQSIPNIFCHATLKPFLIKASGGTNDDSIYALCSHM